MMTCQARFFLEHISNTANGLADFEICLYSVLPETIFDIFLVLPPKYITDFYSRCSLQTTLFSHTALFNLSNAKVRLYRRTGETAARMALTLHLQRTATLVSEKGGNRSHTTCVITL